MLYFGGYELGKLVVPGSAGFSRDAAVGAMAQLLAGVVYTPVDVVKERMQVQALASHLYSYKGTFHAFKSLVQQDGFLGLFRGYWATNCVWIPWNILYIASYEQMKLVAASRLQLQDAEQLPSWAVAGSSASAAAVAAIMTHPADVVKTRLQVLSGGGAVLTMGAVARRILAEEGARGFMSGVGARVMNIAPGCAISWAVYEAIKQRLLS